MTAISFSVFKDALKNGSKTQTIRKIGKEALWHWNNDGPVRIQVGTPLQIYWMQRSKKVFGCPECSSTNVQDDTVNPLDYHCRDCDYNPISDLVQIDGSEKLFDAVCTETFLIKMWKLGDGSVSIAPLEGVSTPEWRDDLAKRDGFEAEWKEIVPDVYICCGNGKKIPNKSGIELVKTSAEKMFEWFDEKYDLSKPQTFQVIRWEARK